MSESEPDDESDALVLGVALEQREGLGETLALGEGAVETVCVVEPALLAEAQSEGESVADVESDADAVVLMENDGEFDAVYVGATELLPACEGPTETVCVVEPALLADAQSDGEGETDVDNDADVVVLTEPDSVCDLVNERDGEPDVLRLPLVDIESDDVDEAVYVERHCASTTASWYHPAQVTQ